MKTGVYLKGALIHSLEGIVLFRKGDIFTISTPGMEGDYDVRTSYMDTEKNEWKVILINWPNEK